MDGWLPAFVSNCLPTCLSACRFAYVPGAICVYLVLSVFVLSCLVWSCLVWFGGRSETISFPLSGVIAGWTEGLQLMREGGKATLVIPSDLGYGAVRVALPPTPPHTHPHTRTHTHIHPLRAPCLCSLRAAIGLLHVNVCRLAPRRASQAAQR